MPRKRTPKKCCLQCERKLPATAEFFGRNAANEDGLHSECRLCRSQTQTVQETITKDAKIELLEEKIAQLKAVGLDRLHKYLSGITTDNASRKTPHIADLYSKLMLAFGGEDGFAAHLVKMAVDEEVPNSVKVKVYQLIAKMSETVSQKGLLERDLDKFSDKDLDEELERRLGYARQEQEAIHRLRQAELERQAAEKAYEQQMKEVESLDDDELTTSE